MEIEAKFCSNIEKRIMHVVLYVCLCLQIRQNISQGSLEMGSFKRMILSCWNCVFLRIKPLCGGNHAIYNFCLTMRAPLFCSILISPWLEPCSISLFKLAWWITATSELHWILHSCACWVRSNLGGGFVRRHVSNIWTLSWSWAFSLWNISKGCLKLKGKNMFKDWQSEPGFHGAKFCWRSVVEMGGIRVTAGFVHIKSSRIVAACVAW